MKVKVSFAKPTTMMKTETYEQMVAEIERLTKENKDLQDALFIAERNKALREAGWDVLHKRITELERENRGLQMKLDGEDYFGAQLQRDNDSLRADVSYYKNLAEDMTDSLSAKAAELAEARVLIAELNDQIAADEEEVAGLKADKEILQGFRQETAEENEALVERINELKEQLLEKGHVYDQAFKGAGELATMLAQANEDKEAMLDEIGELNVELMDRDARIDELEKRVAWLQNEAGEAETSYQNLLAENVQLLDENVRLKQAVNAASKSAADWSAKCQYEEDRAETAEQKLADMKAANDSLLELSKERRQEIDTLQRQLKANEESYMQLWDKYLPLERACKDIAEVIQK